MGRDNMGSIITADDQEALEKIRKFILVEHNDIALPLINDKVGQMAFKGIEIIDKVKVYSYLVEIIECDPDDNEISRKEKLFKYLFYGGRIKTLETYQREKQIKSRRRKRKVYF